ncbi:MAG: hypothetical protein OIF58_07875 [Cohaesibacter sp.]|nr:hypothetical protein [Cohaesibacter sp.]
MFRFVFFLLMILFGLCRLPVVFEQEMLRGIHQELPLERIWGRTPCQHGPQQCAQFASKRRVKAVLKSLEDAGVEAFVEPVGINMEYVKPLLDVVSEWLFSVFGPFGSLPERNHDVWGGMVLSEREVRQIAAVAVAQTAMKLKFLKMYIDIQTMRRAHVALNCT